MNNQTAFPLLIVDRPKELLQYNGMTLRDYFAARAMQALLGYEESTLQNDAEVAYQMADAMLKARE